MRPWRFRDREDAGRQLAAAMRDLELTDPVVLAIPRGGIEVAAPIARELGAELDVVLSRKLRAPDQPELAIGAISETGEVYFESHTRARDDLDSALVEDERQYQLKEIERRKRLFRAVRPPAQLTGRSIIIVDDGIATGSTMIAALQAVRAAGAKEVIVAVPVASADRLELIRKMCDRVVCLQSSDLFGAIGEFYRDFEQVEDERVVELLRSVGRASAG